METHAKRVISLPDHICNSFKAARLCSRVAVRVGTTEASRFMQRSKKGSPAADAVSGVLSKTSGCMLGSTRERDGVSGASSRASQHLSHAWVRRRKQYKSLGRKG